MSCFAEAGESPCQIQADEKRAFVPHLICRSKNGCLEKKRREEGVGTEGGAGKKEKQEGNKEEQPSRRENGGEDGGGGVEVR